MKQILVIADPIGTEQFALQKAIRLAKLSDAKLHLVFFCYDALADVDYSGEVPSDRVDVKKLLCEHVEHQWQALQAKEPMDVDISYEIVWEKYLHTWVLSHCQSTHYDLLVKTGHRSENFFYTSTDWHLFRESPVPVYCLSDPAYTPKKVVLVCLDLLAKSKEKQQLNERLLETAFQMSVLQSAELHACYAIQIPTLVKDLDLVDVTAKTHQLEREARDRAKGYAELYDLDKAHLHIREGKAWQVVNTFARKLKAECVVIGSLGRKGIAAKLIGNTAEKVIHAAVTDLVVL